MTDATFSDRARRAPERDPAWLPRLFWTSAALVLLWPLGVATEFRPWVLLEPGNLKISAQFVGSFWPLALGSDFLAMVARETWRTVAIATAGHHAGAGSGRAADVAVDAGAVDLGAVGAHGTRRRSGCARA